MAFLSGRFVRQTIVDAFRPDGLSQPLEHVPGTRLSKCVTRYRDDSYWRGFSCRYQYLWSEWIVAHSQNGRDGGTRSPFLLRNPHCAKDRFVNAKGWY